MEIISITIIAILIIIAFLDYEPRKRSKKVKAKGLETFELSTKGKPEFVHKPHEALILDNVESINAYLKKIFYVIVNDPEGEFAYGEFDLVDKAILFELSNGKWINWIWEEEGNFGPEFQISFIDERERLIDPFTTLIDMSNRSNWENIQNKKLDKIEVKRLKYHSGEEYITDLILHTENESISISGIQEPEPSKLPEIEDVHFANDWTIIIFDENLKNRILAR